MREVRSTRLAAIGLTLVALQCGASTEAPSPTSSARIPPSRDGVPARPFADASASEYWDLTARFETGHLLFVRFMITNLGPGSRNAAATWHLVTPDGQALRFRNARRKGRWQLSPDGLRIEIGSSLLDQHGPNQRLRFDKKKARFDLEYVTGPRSQIQTEADEVALLSTAAPIRGSLWVRGMPEPLRTRGRVAVSHTWLGRAEADLELRRVEFFSLDPEDPLYVLETTAPSGQRRTWVRVESEGRVVYESDHVDLCLDEPRSEAYPLPRFIRVQDGEVNGRIDVEPPLVRYEPLQDMPFPFRWWLKRSMRPLRVWVRAPFRVTLARREDREPLQLEGRGIGTVTFSNPFSRLATGEAASRQTPCEFESAS